ncbi:bifunctional 2-keto-4-hydroxyglutarate aldolase/2-keto-3-deoxy-6-phosphogluconate aldolase [Paenibacillus abyssi]|uniref:Bifunctional 2-keto-4-hydroxyglutarate aldolase/2-keto-3-deoxy-6-phosphogluconate aldolase n=1 Tax=Paenibacillus abyssi TaxID=1340531 RepID=A0A917CYH5_9BACL|nr:bifunctional 2-keto-4-hydroxyglutarate aldolase/2-keto-3-deoxy-6-phosphogluconate aldolase [Paenibacillus abyssi]GGG01644.1 bifunctional 2-keto-4-hydroxyglutarate aldolase/2-keto-3-deoxy-6-phosphogluconate aldolase [Paenibacillus abyssi]
MSNKQSIINKICEVGIVSVVRAESSDKALQIADACIEGGIPSIEITFTVPRAHKIISDLAHNYLPGEMILGAGTVLDAETARIAILSGAQYIVMPYFNKDVVRLCNRYAIPCMPGVMTIKEIVEAMESGADIVKLFPGEMYNPGMIKTIKGPLPYAQIMPTGGVDLDNIGEWIKAGAVAVGVGSSLTRGAQSGDYASITELGRKFIAKIKETRQLMSSTS